MALLTRRPDLQAIRTDGEPQLDEEIVVTSILDGKEYKRTGGCISCGACCRAMLVPLDPRVILSPQFEDWTHWLDLHGVHVIIRQDGRLDAWFPIPCGELSEEGLCKLFGKEERPRMCSTFPQQPLELEGLPDCTYKFGKLGGEGDD